MSLTSYPPDVSNPKEVKAEVIIEEDSMPQMHVDSTDGDNVQESSPLPLQAKQYTEGWRLAIVIGSLCLGTLLVALDTTIIFVAIPRISTTFHSLEDIGWYGSAYLLTIMAFQASAAKIFKHFRVKVSYLMSILIFEGTNRSVCNGTCLGDTRRFSLMPYSGVNTMCQRS